MDERRVVITGMGAVSPLGLDVQTTWERLIAGESGAGPITHFDHGDYKVHFACEVKEFDPTNWIDRKDARRMDRFAHLVVAAARMAEADAGLDIAAESDRVGASIATGIGGIKSFQECYDTLITRGPDRVNPFAIPAIIPNLGAGWVSIMLGTRGPLGAQCTACAASNMAIGDGLDTIRLGRADVMLCGGTEAAVNEVGIAGFAAMRALSLRNDAPEQASRPFDKGRDGFVLGEGAGVLVLESEQHAASRGARVYAVAAGAGYSGDAHHIAQPDPDGAGAVLAIRRALENAGVAAAQVTHVNAHATSTPAGDVVEARAIAAALGDAASSVVVSATKSMTGHLLGGAGAIESVAAIMALHDKTAPPTINVDDLEDDLGVEIAVKPTDLISRGEEPMAVLNNSFGFGGHNVTVVFTAP